MSTTSRIIGALAALLAAAPLAGCKPQEPVKSQFVRAPRIDIRPRNVVSERWDTIWAWGGPEDTLLSAPGFMDASREGVFLFDYIDQRLLAFDTAGRVRWTYGGKGQGPGEFMNVRDIVVGAGGGVDLLDAENARITRVDRNGRVARLISIADVDAYAGQMVPLPDGRFLLLTSQADSSVVVVDSTGRVTERSEFPWAGYARLQPIARQGFATEDGTSWIFAFAMGDGWFASQGARTSVHGFVEHLDFPELVTEQRGRDTRVTRKARYHPCTACSLSLSGSTLSVLFGGYSRDAYRLLDEYRSSDGQYLGSRKLPSRSHLIAVQDRTYYVIVEDPAPRLLALRPSL
jgi:hypothetical protein